MISIWSASRCKKDRIALLKGSLGYWIGLDITEQINDLTDYLRFGVEFQLSAL
jgi:hypothetical protein